MNRIRLLPEQVANQIAAGEVIERPASVVKELVENAIDAGARRITVEVDAGGRSLVRVTDDGVGMSRDDALLSLERHATSKIREAGDLASIQTLGFRGEALPSIASVSRFVLTTREREGGGVEATQVVVHGGRVVEVTSAPGAPGTVIEARQLFFNLPARRKFMRTEETERAHVQHYLSLVAMACPEVGLTLVLDGRVAWQLPPVVIPVADAIGGGGGEAALRLDALKERLRILLGAELPLVRVNAESGLRVSSEGEDEGGGMQRMRVWGYIGAPGVSRGSREDQHLFVNRRPVEHRGLNHALLEGYHTALMKGRFPVCCLFLELPPAEVDVNVHPAKREVRFHLEGPVRRALADAVRGALLGYHRATTPPAVSVSGPGSGSGQAPGVGDSDPMTRVLPGVVEPPASVSGPVQEVLPIQSHAGPMVPDAGSTPALPSSLDVGMPSRMPVGSGAFPAVAGCQPLAVSGGSVRADGVVGGGILPLLEVPLRLVGVVGRLYVVFESDRGLVLLDQHAAHERVLFEQMLDRLQQGDAPSQRLLLAETVELSVRDAQFVAENLGVLNRLGVGLSEFGDRTYLLDALPPFVKAREARAFVVGLVDALKEAGEGVNSLRLGEDVVAKTVCRHAVKANDPLAGAELENLVSDLRRCRMPYTCPHGRPTLIEMNYRELERKFGRAQG